MNFSMQDIVPWSLIYSAQNDKHQSEIHLMEANLDNKNIRMRQFAYMMVVNLLNSSSNDFDDNDSDVWKHFTAVVDILNNEDIDAATVEVITGIDTAYGFVSPSAHTEIYRQSEICKLRLP